MSDHRSHDKTHLATAVLDNLPGMVFRAVNDGEWTFEFVSRGSQALFGYTPAELVDIRTFRNMIPEADQVENRKLVKTLSPQQPCYQIVYRIRIATGRTKWVKEEGTGVFTTRGELLALDGFVMDITEQKLQEKRLREDFYYRINTLRLRMPTLRERKDDIPLLADVFAARYAASGERPRFTAPELAVLHSHNWPGNVRELQNVIYRYVTLGTLELTGSIRPAAAAPPPGAEAPGATPEGRIEGLAAVEKRMIAEALERHRWHVGKAAAALGFSRRTMQRRMGKYHLRR